MEKYFNTCCICGEGGLVCQRCNEVFFDKEVNFTEAIKISLEPNAIQIYDDRAIINSKIGKIEFIKIPFSCSFDVFKCEESDGFLSSMRCLIENIANGLYQFDKKTSKNAICI